MIQAFVRKWEERKGEVEEIFRKEHPESYEAIVREVIKILNVSEWSWEAPDPERIHVIDDGHYQGTLLFIIADKSYQPSTYWAVKISYGSCSVCDTLERIRGYEDGVPNTEQVNDYMTLALHIVQGLKEIGED